ncbi:MAG: hypothetical protein K0R61_3037, partial [Microvirga sp.]|nr:hypothetical protein [Microvirga sp.]
PSGRQSAASQQQSPLSQSRSDIPERATARTGDRPTGRRIIARHSFELYDDQIDSLRRLSLQEKMDGKLGSMSQMVREAIDTYLKDKAQK